MSPSIARLTFLYFFTCLLIGLSLFDSATMSNHVSISRCGPLTPQFGCWLPPIPFSMDWSNIMVKDSEGGNPRVFHWDVGCLLVCDARELAAVPESACATSKLAAVPESACATSSLTATSSLNNALWMPWKCHENATQTPWNEARCC